MSDSSDEEFVIEPKIEFMDELTGAGATPDASVPSSETTSAQFRWILTWLKENKFLKTFDVLVDEYEAVLDQTIAAEINGSAVSKEAHHFHMSNLWKSFGSIHSSSSLALAIHPSKPWLVSTDANKNLVITNFETEVVLSNERDNNPFMGSIISMNLNPVNPNIILLGTMDAKFGLVQIVEKGEELSVKHLDQFEIHRKYVVRVKWSRDGKFFATASHDKSVAIYSFDLESKKSTLLQHIHLLQTVEAIEWLHDGSKLVVSQRETSHLVYIDLSTWAQTKVSLNALGDDHVSFTVLELAFNNDGSALLVLTDKNRAILMKTLQPIQLRNFYGFHSDVLAQPRAVFDNNGLIYITSQDNKIAVFDPRTEKNIANLEGHSNLIRGIVYSKERNFIATCSYDKTVKFWTQ